jgi:hypothetical protein
MKLISKVNWTYVIVSFILGFAIVGYAAFNYAAKQNQLELRNKKKKIKLSARKHLIIWRLI